MSAFEIAEKNNDSNSLEQLSLIYGNNIALINRLIESLNSDKLKSERDDNTSNKYIEVRRKLLYTFVNAFSEGELEVYGNKKLDGATNSHAKDALENYFILLNNTEYDFDDLTSTLNPNEYKNDTSKNDNREEDFKISFFIYLTKFTLHLKFLLNYNDDLKLRDFAKEIIQQNGLEGRINQVIRSMNLYLHYIDTISESTSNKRELKYISKELTAKNQQPHQIAKLCLSLLKNYKYVKDLNLYTEEFILEFLEYYFSTHFLTAQHHIGAQNYSLIESMIRFSDIYNKKGYLGLIKTDKIDNIWLMVDKSLHSYFNQFLPTEISSVNKRVDVLMNYHLDYLSSIYQDIGDGETALLFRLLSYLFNNEIENALEIVKSRVFFIDTISIPLYIDKGIYNKNIISFLHFYARFNEYAEIQKNNFQLFKEIEKLLKIHSGYPGEPLFPLLESIFDEKSIPDKSLPLPNQYSFKVAPAYLQANLFVRLLSFGKKQEEFISSWGSSEILDDIKTLAPQFDKSLADHFLKIHNYFNQPDAETPNSYKIDPVIDAHWQILNQIPTAILESNLKSPRTNEKIIRLAQITLEFGKKYDAVDGLYRFINFWFNNQKIMFKIQGFNKKTFTHLCKRVSDNVRKHYEGLPLFYWKLQHRKIRDEINVFLNTLSIEI